MPRPLVLLALSAILVLALGYQVSQHFAPRALPFSFSVIDAKTAMIEPRSDVPLPDGLRPGDRIDLAALDQHARNPFFHVSPLGAAYTLVVERDGTEFPVRVAVMDGRSDPTWARRAWTTVLPRLLAMVIALLLLWRGRDLAARGAALWIISFEIGTAFSVIPVDDAPAVAALLTGAMFHLLARVGFYIMIEAIVGVRFSAKARRLYRVVMAVLLLVGAVQCVGQFALYWLVGWSDSQSPVYGYLMTVSFVWPFVMLAVGYARAHAEERARLRWMLLAGAVQVFAILLSNTPLLGSVATAIALPYIGALSMAGFLYAILRHRILDLSVVLDRTLVYGAMTALVVGVVAALNSLAIKETLGPGAGLTLQIVVPLALGIVLGRVRSLLDLTVERVFFRSKYLAERHLRRFARSAGQFQDLSRLVAAATEEIARATATPAIGLYVPAGDVYLQVSLTGEPRFPKTIQADDLALAAARAELQPIELAEVNSALGGNGVLFPMVVLGVERGVIVCADRPGQVFARDEKALLAEVASQVGAAYRILKARENEALVDALASGTVKTLKVARERARALKFASASD